MVEQGGPAGQALISQLFPLGGRAKIIGVTGPAGSGKSTLVNACVRESRLRHLRVGVIAIDPSSSLSQGAILGDRIRMMEHYADEGVFIRSAANRGHLGGLAAATLDLCILLDAAGFDLIFVETVGVGQDEVEIAGLAHISVVVLPPASGDDIQAIKAGIMEIADLFVINKADLPGAGQLAEEIGFVQSLSPEGKRAPILHVVSTRSIGVPELMDALLSAFEGREAGFQPAPYWNKALQQIVKDKLLHKLNAADLARHADLVSRRLEDPYAAANSLLEEILSRDQAHKGQNA